MKKAFFILTTLIIFIFTVTACTKEPLAVENSVNKPNSQKNTVVQNDNKAKENKKVSERQILWDFRKDEQTNSPNFSQAETNAVVKYLFGKTDSEIVISSRLSGAFTKPNAKETLYYLTGCNDEETGKFTTRCPHVSWNTEGWIAIYDGTTPILKINQPLGSSADKVTDLNGDGKNEIMSFSGYGQSGIQTQSLAIGEISDGKYSGIKGFDGWADDCGYGETLSNDKKKAMAVVIKYLPMNGEIPAFEEEYFETGCKDDAPDQTAWKKTDQKTFEEFFISNS